MTRKLIENWRKWRHLDAESAVVQETFVLFENVTQLHFSWVIL